jgi:hypothetical protein
VVILLAVLAPQVAAFGYLAIALSVVLTARGGDPEAGLRRESPRRRWRRGGETPAD